MLVDRVSEYSIIVGEFFCLCQCRLRIMDAAMTDLICEIRASVREGIRRGLHMEAGDGQICIPAKEAAVSCSVLVRTGSDASSEAESLNTCLDIFPAVFGAKLLSRVRGSRGWLLFDLSGELYDLAAKTALPAADRAEGESFCYYRMKMLARYPSRGCPDDESVRRALLLCWTAYSDATQSARKQAEDALLTIGRQLPASERQNLIAKCGDIGRTALRLLSSE